MLPLFDNNPHSRTPWIVILIILGCVGTFAVEFTQESPRALASFVAAWGLVPREIARFDDPHRGWSILTSMFLHGGLLHLAGNCWFLWIFGNNVEDRLGPLRFLIFYLLCGTAAAAVQVATGMDSAVPMIGASGAISGVLGAYLVLWPRALVYTLVPLWFAPVLPIPAMVFLLLWFAMQAWNGLGTMLSPAGAAGGVAWWAHIGGFTAGVLLVRLFAPRGARRRM